MLGADRDLSIEPVEQVGKIVSVIICDVRFAPILLQKSACRRGGTAGAFFETIDCHPLDYAGDLRSTLLTLATLTQRTKGRTVVAGRPTWQACGGSAQSLPT
jgi:hypothetical protein